MVTSELLDSCVFSWVFSFPPPFFPNQFYYVQYMKLLRTTEADIKRKKKWKYEENILWGTPN